MMADVEEVELVVAHSERATLRVGDVFLKIDTDQARIDREVEVMARAPIPTPEVLWRKPPVLALAAVPGAALGVLKEPSRASSAAWVAAGANVRTLHDAILQYRGMSLHRWLRLRRLWLVRPRLLAGTHSVKAAALAFGFWHLSDFSHNYSRQFGESPSVTLARARGH